MKRVIMLIAGAALAILGSASVEAQCTSPAVPAFLFTPPGDVGAGETYGFAWSDTVAGVDDYYVIERSRTSSFSTIFDSQQVSIASATFLVDAEGDYFHRVRAVPGCNPALASANSASAKVHVGSGDASVVVTVQPKPVITNLGDSFVGRDATFVIENVTKRPVTVFVTTETLGDAANFFEVFDPGGGDLFLLTLQPRTPKTLKLRFSGFPTPVGVRRSYQGVVIIGGGELPNITYAFVNLKVGGSDSAPPYFSLDGLPVEYVYFPGFAGADDSSRSPVDIEVVNPGGSQLEIGAEIGPELWLEPEDGWNSDPITAGGSLDVSLFTKRERAFPNSPLPRYTYLTIYTKTGETARLLVQDNDEASVASGRTKLGKTARSYVIPGIVSGELGNGQRLYSIVTLTNASASDVTAELYFTPDDADGFSSVAAKRALVIVPGNDVVRLTDPLLQIFGVSTDVSGQLEVRGNSDPIGFLTVTARVFTPDDGGVGGVGYRLPVTVRGEGARDDTPHSIPGVTIRPSEATELILAETTGVDSATLNVRLVDSSGSTIGSKRVVVSRYGQTRIENLLTSFGAGSQLVGGRLDITVNEGKGSVVGTLLVRDSDYRGWTLVSQPAAGPLSKIAAAAARYRISWPTQMFVRPSYPTPAEASSSIQYVIPNVISGALGSLPGTISTTVGIASPTTGSTTATLTLVSSTGSQAGQKTINIGAGQTMEYANVVADLFGLSGAFDGILLADSSNVASLFYARLHSTNALVTTTLAIPIVTSASESLTGATPGENRPIYIDGIEQSVDDERGSTWTLVVNEVCNVATTFEIRVYEAGNRVVPVAVKTFEIGPLQEVRLDPVFAQLGLASETRSKDRINVMVVVVPKSGGGLLSAVAQVIDNRTGDVVGFRLTPSGGVPATGIQLAAPIPDEPEQTAPDRRRPVRRPG